jgi:hypothetical protein
MQPLKAWHGTSATRSDSIRESGGLEDPYLAATEKLAEYYAEEVATSDGGEPIVLELIVRDTSKLRHDYAAMDEPVVVGELSEKDRDNEWERAEKEHPEWMRDDLIFIPQEEWEYSWRGAHSVKYEGLLPLHDILTPVVDDKTSAKEPWQMTKNEFIAERMRLINEFRELSKKHGGHPTSAQVPEVREAFERQMEWGDIDMGHRPAVAQAIAADKPVPPVVLEDYPELVTKYHRASELF